MSGIRRVEDQLKELGVCRAGEEEEVKQGRIQNLYSGGPSGSQGGGLSQL